MKKKTLRLPTPPPLQYKITGNIYTQDSRGMAARRYATKLFAADTLKLVARDLKKVKGGNLDSVRVEYLDFGVKKESECLVIDVANEKEARQMAPMALLYLAAFKTTENITVLKIDVKSISKTKNQFDYYYSDLVYNYFPDGKWNKPPPKYQQVEIKMSSPNEVEVVSPDIFDEGYKPCSLLTLDEINIQLTLGIPPVNMLKNLKLRRDERLYNMCKQLLPKVKKNICPICNKPFDPVSSNFVECDTHGTFYHKG